MKDTLILAAILAAFALWWWRSLRRPLTRGAASADAAPRAPAPAPQRVLVALHRLEDAVWLSELSARLAAPAGRVLLAYLLEVPLQFELKGYDLEDAAILERLDAAAVRIRGLGREPQRRILRTRDSARSLLALADETAPELIIMRLPAAGDWDLYAPLARRARLLLAAGESPLPKAAASPRPQPASDSAALRAGGR